MNDSGVEPRLLYRAAVATPRSGQHAPHASARATHGSDTAGGAYDFLERAYSHQLTIEHTPSLPFAPSSFKHIMASQKQVAENMLWGGRFTGQYPSIAY